MVKSDYIGCLLLPSGNGFCSVGYKYCISTFGSIWFKFLSVKYAAKSVMFYKHKILYTVCILFMIILVIIYDLLVYTKRYQANISETAQCCLNTVTLMF